MPDQEFELDVLRDLLEEARIIGQLAEDEGAFREAYEAFRAGDVRKFQDALKPKRLRCSLICEWIRIKECIFVCLKLCGAPKPTDQTPKPRELAEAIVQITSDEKLVRQLAKAVEERDHDSFQRIVEQFRLGNLCHYFCHWLCVVRYRLICRWLCSIKKIERPNFARELQSAGQALRQLLEHKDSFDQAVAASDAGNAAKLAAVIQTAQLLPVCHFICEWFCSWRCTRVCLILCRQFPLEPIQDEIREAFAFAKAMQQLGQEPVQLERLSSAVGAGNAETYSTSVKKLKLQRFCIQLCHWICFLRCRRFCIRVCPPDEPWFHHIGDFGIYADIDSGTGLTNKPQPQGVGSHGGPNYGFFGCLELRGYCPRLSPTFPGEPMAYRFLFQEAGAPNPTPITKPYVCTVYVTSRRVYWFDNVLKNKWQSIWIRGDNPSVDPPPGVEPDSDFFVVPDANGWVQVIPTSPSDDAFSGGLMGFASWVASPGSYDADPAPGVAAGTAVSLANQRKGIDVAIIFQATRASQISAATPDYTNEVSKVHINNWLEVGLLDLQEFLSPGATCCTPLTTDLHILYTADHELMAQWYIDMVTCPPGPSPAPTFPSGTGPRGGAGSDPHDISTWPMCSYLIRLFTRRSLTTGLEDDDLDNIAAKTFCIGPRGR